RAAPTSSSSRRRSWTRTPSSLPKGDISPPRRRARSQRTPMFPGWCRFISPPDTSTGRINFDGRAKPRGEDEAAGHVLRACEVADFAEDGCPKIETPLQESQGGDVRQRVALEFQRRASQMKWCDGRHQFVRRVPPSLGPLATSSGLF